MDEATATVQTRHHNRSRKQWQIHHLLIGSENEPPHIWWPSDRKCLRCWNALWPLTSGQAKGLILTSREGPVALVNIIGFNKDVFIAIIKGLSFVFSCTIVRNEQGLNSRWDTWQRLGFKPAIIWLQPWRFNYQITGNPTSVPCLTEPVLASTLDHSPGPGSYCTRKRLLTAGPDILAGASDSTCLKKSCLPWEHFLNETSSDLRPAAKPGSLHINVFR